MKWMCHGLSWRNPIDNRFSPHAFHLDKKVEVFAAEGSPDHRQIHVSTLCSDYRPLAFSSPLQTDHNHRGGGGGGNIRGSFHHTITTGREGSGTIQVGAYTTPQSQGGVGGQVTSAQIPFILKRKLKFFPQRGVILTRNAI